MPIPTMLMSVAITASPAGLQHSFHLSLMLSLAPLGQICLVELCLTPQF